MGKRRKKKFTMVLMFLSCGKKAWSIWIKSREWAEERIGSNLKNVLYNIANKRCHKRNLWQELKGQCHDIQWFFALFLREQNMATARASVADISSVSRPTGSFTAPAESSKCSFPRASVVFRGLALWPPLFSPTQNGCQKSPIIVTLPL